jgi:hypothetical protein
MLRLPPRRRRATQSPRTLPMSRNDCAGPIGPAHSLNPEYIR